MHARPAASLACLLSGLAVLLDAPGAWSFGTSTAAGQGWVSFGPTAVPDCCGRDAP
jgi:hypothetical protein